MRALVKLTWVELKLFVREPVTLVFTLILPLIFLIVMGEVFGKNPGTDSAFRGVNAMDYYAPAYIGIVLAAVGLVAIPVHLAGYRERGILRRLRASSLSLRSLFAAQLLVSFLISIVCVAILILPSIFIYHIFMPFNLGFVIGGAILAMLCFTAIGIFLGFVLPSARATQGVGMPLFFFMYIMSGGGPPRAVMSPAMQKVGEIMPVWHTTSLVQDAWLGYGWNGFAALILVGYLVLAAGLTFLLFRRE
jgi:ABC-2 type transport system permease protein